MSQRRGSPQWLVLIVRGPGSTVTITRCYGLANHETDKRGWRQPASRAVVVSCCQRNCWVGIAVAPCGKVDDRYLDCWLTVLLCLCVVVFLQRVGKRGIPREGGAWYAITFRCPGAEVGHLTSFRAEGAPGVAFPGDGLVAEGTGHARHCTTLNPRIGQRSTLADLMRGGDLQQSV